MTRCAVVGTRDNPSIAVLLPGQSWFPGAIGPGGLGREVARKGAKSEPCSGIRRFTSIHADERGRRWRPMRLNQRTVR